MNKLNAATITTLRLSLIFAVCVLFTTVVQAGFIYTVIDSTVSNRIYGYSVNETTGALTLLPGFPMETGFTGFGGTNLEMIAIDKLNKRLYVLNRGSNNISAYSINETTGALTSLPFSPINNVPEQRMIKVHPSGSPLIVGADVFTSHVITADSATPAEGSPYAMPANVSPTAGTLAPDGSFFYAGGNTGNFFAGYSVNAKTGVLTSLPGNAFDSGNQTPNPTTIDSNGRLWVINSRQSIVRAYTLADGVPQQVTNSPFTVLETGFAAQGKVHPNGQFLYVGNRTRNHVYAFNIVGTGSETTLSLINGAPFATGGTASLVNTFNSNGNFFYTGNGSSRNITTFSVEQETGALTSLGVSDADSMGSSGTIAGMEYVNFAEGGSTSVSIGGKLNWSGLNVYSATSVSITDPSGNVRTAAFNPFGFYTFDNVAVPASYTFRLIDRRMVLAEWVEDLTEANTEINITNMPVFTNRGPVLKKAF